MKKLTHAAFVAALLVTAMFINAPPAATNQLFNGRFISDGPRIYLALQPRATGNASGSIQTR